MAQTYYIVNGPKAGIPLYMMPAFNFDQVLQNVAKFKISNLILVPPIVVALAKHPAVRDGSIDLSSVTSMGSGAAPLGREVSEEVESIWPKGQVNVKQGWGMTE
jgi:4-coumarate--CoA ligase